MTATRVRQDEEILADVRREMKWDPRIDQAPITIDVTDGVITLGGRVESAARKLAAFDATTRVKGVRGVIDNIEVHVIPRRDRA